MGSMALIGMDVHKVRIAVGVAEGIWGGDCGLQRQLEGPDHTCLVVAPLLTSSKPGDRVKTGRRDAMALAKLHRVGELTAVSIRDAAHEAMRDLIRTQATARHDSIRWLRRRTHSPRLVSG